MLKILSCQKLQGYVLVVEVIKTVQNNVLAIGLFIYRYSAS